MDIGDRAHPTDPHVRLRRSVLGAMIREFERQSGIPVVLNTSFNENEPIVCEPEQAISCFKRTKMDAIAVGPFFALKSEN